MLGTIGALLAPFWGYIVAGLVAVAGVAGAYIKGRSDQNAKENAKDAKEYRETRNEIDNADHFDDADSAREWLRNRKP